MGTHLCQKLGPQMLTAARTVFVLAHTNSQYEWWYRQLYKLQCQYPMWLCMCRRVGQLTQLTVVLWAPQCEMLGGVPLGCLFLSDTSYRPRIFCRLLHPWRLFFAFVYRNPKTLHTSLVKLSEAMISMVGLFATMLSYSDLESENIIVH